MDIERPTAGPRTAASPRTDGQMRLLIVEDDGSLAAGLARALGLEGYAVEHLTSGEAALARIAKATFTLGGLGGRRPAGTAVPGVGLKGAGAVGDRVLGRALGADDYMTKPFALPGLAARVRALIRRGQADAGPRTTHGPLELDRAGRRAFLQGNPLELAAREWAVLQILLEKVEKVVSKEAFIESLTNWEEDLSANAIEVYISRLRAKLEPAGIRIRTVRGFGYMLEEYQARDA